MVTDETQNLSAFLLEVLLHVASKGMMDGKEKKHKEDRPALNCTLPPLTFISRPQSLALPMCKEARKMELP